MAVKSNDVVSKDTANKKMVETTQAQSGSTPVVANNNNAADNKAVTNSKSVQPNLMPKKIAVEDNSTTQVSGASEAAKLREELVKKHMERLGVKKTETEVVPDKQDEKEVVTPEVKDDEVEVAEKVVEADSDEAKDSSIDSQANDESTKDAVHELAKSEEIDPELAKDFAVKKLLKRIDALTSKSKQLESKLEKETVQPSANYEDVEKWTPEYADTIKKQYQQAIDTASDMLFDEVKRDEDGNEIPLDINGTKTTRKELRKMLRSMQEEASKIDGYVKSREQVQVEREKWTAQAVKSIEWFGDESNQVFSEAKEKWDEINRKGLKNVPYAEYVFAKGWDAIVKEHNASKKNIEVKKPEPKPTTPKAAVAAKPIVNQNKRDDVEVLKEKAEKTGKPEDMRAYLTAFHAKRLSGK